MAGYAIGSAKGKSIASGMKAGTTYKASDGSTWKKNSDGGVSVTTKQGGYTANALGGNTSSSTPSSSSSSRSSGGSGSKAVTVGSSGNAAKGLSMGTVVNTAGGNYKIVDKNTAGASYNPTSGYYSVKVPSASTPSASTPSNNSNVGTATKDKAAKVASYQSILSGNNNAKSEKVNNMYGMLNGSISTSANNGLTDEQKMAANSKAWFTADANTKKKLESDNQTLGAKQGLSYNSAAGTWSKPTAGAATQNTTAATQAKAGTTATTIIRNGKEVSGYIDANGKTFDSGGNRAVAGDQVRTGSGKIYLMTDTGKGIDITSKTKANVYRKDEQTGQYNLNNAVGNVYITDSGESYDASTGRRYNAVGDVVEAQNDKYYEVGTGKDVTAELQNSDLVPEEKLPIYEEEEMQQYVDELNGLVDQNLQLDPTLTAEQARAMAQEQFASQYSQASDDAMAAIDKNALQSGFFGQLPTEALKRETAGKLEVEKLNAIYGLASQLYGQSEESAYNKLNAATTTQQNKIANMLSLLGLATNERDYQDSKKLTEGELTGNYNGTQTLDFLRMLNSNKS